MKTKPRKNAKAVRKNSLPPLPYLWERLTADDFAQAVRASDGVALLPLGCLEKHGRHLPLGTDVLIASELCRRAASMEPAVVVPCPPFGLVSEVRNGPGTLALRADTLLAMLRDLCADLARNGLTKIVIVNGHGGNQELLRYFLRERLEEDCPYALYLFRPEWRGDEEKRYAAMIGRDALPECGHACIQETPEVMAIAPETVRMDRVVPDETHRLGRLAALREAFLSTSVDWYADYPAQIAGDPTGSTPELGEWLLSLHADKLVRAIRAVRADAAAPAILAEYQARSRAPLRPS